MSSVHPWAENHSHGAAAVSREPGAVAAEAPDRRRARRSRMAAPLPVQSFVKHVGYKSERRASISESAHAHVLFLGQRTAQVGALLPGLVATANAVYSGTGPGADRKGIGNGAQLVLEYRRSVPEMPCHGRSGARQDCDRAEFPACQRATEAGLGGALGGRSAGHQPGNIDAIGIVPARKQSLGLCRTNTTVVPRLRR